MSSAKSCSFRLGLNVLNRKKHGLHCELIEYPPNLTVMVELLMAYFDNLIAIWSGDNGTWLR